ncbi:MAG: carboxypeptidase-like regulatory domain-containing protein, partial [Bacteroidales bacterium]|nr:carboxypeptidase-like regulatory domain-containing protein [Bacteroidales bacterium]
MNRLTLKAFLMVLCGLLVSTTLFAQRTVRGTVTDPSGEPVIGAAVLVSGTTQGTITEVDGSYSISVPAGASLEFSCLGYLSRTVAVGQQNVINVTLELDNMQLDETVVVGYGTHKKETLTGSIVTVKGEELTKSPAPN